MKRRDKERNKGEKGIKRRNEGVRNKEMKEGKNIVNKEIKEGSEEDREKGGKKG